MQPATAGCGDDDGRSSVKVRISLIAVACAAVTAVLGVGSAHAAVVKSYCIDGETATLSGTAPLDFLHQFQLDGFAAFGGAYTAEGFSFGADPDAASEPESLMASLGDLDDIISLFPISGGVFHPVTAGACAVTQPPPTTTPPATTPAAVASADPGPPRGEEGIFLCYSKFQVDPGVWQYSMAQQLLAGGGYWKPYAVLGTDSSTRIGAYSLVCNPGKVLQSLPAVAVQGGGDLTQVPSELDQLNVYPVLP
jgi:hypothetical protein